MTTVQDDTLKDPGALLAERPELAELSSAQLAPLENRTQAWPDSWRELARSLYISLVFGAQGLEDDAGAQLACELVLGIAADLGGGQLYINQGADIQRSAMAARVIALLAQHRQDYVAVARLVGITDRHVRRIEARWLRAERARRQRELPL
ncbi:Mor transcription activator family protein [Comamonas sp. NLF-1-9]|uniref:Mor transcription activator family protein n=1 Tax=Comamonas sp. NLF-1-9 TaxID=2853163 RepID=UPI001C49048B|nr:Mor transcription activator family protein [Comamonas sp. NLF-1-9]QXL84100.1 hypothetical protein KUD94_12800 [Comamonas sp. NLF-1-9]